MSSAHFTPGVSLAIVGAFAACAVQTQGEIGEQRESDSLGTFLDCGAQDDCVDVLVPEKGEVAACGTGFLVVTQCSPLDSETADPESMTDWAEYGPIACTADGACPTSGFTTELHVASDPVPQPSFPADPPPMTRKEAWPPSDLRTVIPIGDGTAPPIWPLTTQERAEQAKNPLPSDEGYIIGPISGTLIVDNEADGNPDVVVFAPSWTDADKDKGIRNIARFWVRGKTEKVRGDEYKVTSGSSKKLTLDFALIKRETYVKDKAGDPILGADKKRIQAFDYSAFPLVWIDPKVASITKLQNLTGQAPTDSDPKKVTWVGRLTMGPPKK